MDCLGHGASLSIRGAHRAVACQERLLVHGTGFTGHTVKTLPMQALSRAPCHGQVLRVLHVKCAWTMDALIKLRRVGHSEASRSSVSVQAMASTRTLAERGVSLTIATITTFALNACATVAASVLNLAYSTISVRHLCHSRCCCLCSSIGPAHTQVDVCAGALVPSPKPPCMACFHQQWPARWTSCLNHRFSRCHW